ncbi:MAG: penicillin-binding protein 2 [Saprospiraceae bacterium]|nr:penicillin-binding protein 2 [Saprospiraceae bacterium]
MTSSNNHRATYIRWVFMIGALMLIFKAGQLQLWDSSFRSKADAATIGEYVMYPSRGLIYDRNDSLLVNNDYIYDLMVTYNQVDRDMDTLKFCQLLGITKSEFTKRLNKNWGDVRYSKSVPYVFLDKISVETYARFQETLYEFPGFFPQVRNVRGYPHATSPHLLGYIREVNRKELQTKVFDESKGNDSLPVYALGDYIGASGLEKQYEEHLRGKKGLRLVLKDNMGREVGDYNDRKSNIPAISGSNLHTTIDLRLQKYGERLMSNKIGSIVAIEPETGEILAMVSTPTYDPNELTINKDRGRIYAKLQKDSLNPLFNRSLMAQYPPGSLFKPLVALVALEDTLITPKTTISCQAGYYVNGQKLTGCHHHATCTSVASAIQHSCNAYFVNVFRRIVDQAGAQQPSLGLDHFNGYLEDFGLGHKLGIDFPGEQVGNYPSSQYFSEKVYANESNWKSIWIRSLGIGQGELLMTNLQMANMAALLGNRGYYVKPHLVKRIVPEDKPAIVFDNSAERVELDINKAHFETVIEGMERVVTSGTATSAYIPDIVVCGKTGTAENNQRDGKDHSIFFAFAPKDKPKIAIAVYVENGTWGGTYAAPIASLMIEKYLREDGEIVSPNRKWWEKRMVEADLISTLRP